MATLLPPPSKRQKTEVAEKSREQQSVESIPNGLGSIRVQFNDQSTGQPFGTPISVPVVDATARNLELLLNTLQRNVSLAPVDDRFSSLLSIKHLNLNVFALIFLRHALFLNGICP